jgi:hypothetical protein
VLKLSAGAFGAAILIGAGMLTSFLWARVLQDLWRWFVAPLFHLPLLPFWNALGLMMVVSVFTHNIATKEVDEESPWWAKAGVQIIGSAIGALIVWAFGGLYAQWGGV